jgi:hypothetical protein
MTVSKAVAVKETRSNLTNMMDANLGSVARLSYRQNCR